MSKFVFCLIGPTASGKTDLAVKLVNHFPFEIISIDSAMIYREMNIGTAKPDANTLIQAPHHLIDIINPSESYSVANCLKDVESLCEEIFKRKKIPLLVGGTMMYFNAIQNGLTSLPEASEEHRLEILANAKEHGSSFVYQMLKDVDPVSALKINPNDTQRVQRALEVFQITKQPLSSLITEKHFISDFNFINLLLIPNDRAWLHERINLRFNLMLQEGLIEESRELLARWPLNAASPAMRLVGYRQVFAYLQGEIDYNTMLEKACAASRQLAKRQLTWLRKWQKSNVFIAENTSNLTAIMELINKMLDN